MAAVQALAQAYSDYYGAVADYDRAQFRLYHALGHPAQALAGDGTACAAGRRPRPPSRRPPRPAGSRRSPQAACAGRRRRL